MTILIAGLLLGVAGSIHCAGMCGPIVVTVTKFASARPRKAYTQQLAYHTARVFVYAMLGVVAGSTGAVLAASSVGRAIAVIGGVLLIIGGSGTIAIRWTTLPAAWSSIGRRAGLAAMALVRTRPLAGYIVLGLVNGVLPCSVLYGAAAASAAVGTIVGSSLFMIGFGIGTIPFLTGAALAVRLVPPSFRPRLRFAGPLVMVLAGTLLIARGVLPTKPAAHTHSEHSILSRQQ